MGICISSSSNRIRRRNNSSQLISSADPSPPSIYSSQPPPPPALRDGSNYSNNPIIVNPNIAPYNHPRANHNYGRMVPAPPPLPAPAYVEHCQAKKVNNHVHLHKDTLEVEVDEDNPDCHLVSFVFDALVDGSITIYYFAKEEPDCKFVPVYPEVFVPVKTPFQKGNGQRFQQPSGTGIDLGFFDFDSLSKPSSDEDVYPLVICAETMVPLVSNDQHVYDPSSNTVSTPRKQITQAVLEKNNAHPYKARVMRQILWIDGVRYELREILGIGQSGKECVICMTGPKDTALLPCRHMCVCSECAKALRLQSNKCPICRQPIGQLIVIKINKNDR